MVAISRVRRVSRVKISLIYSRVTLTVPPGSHGTRHESQTYFNSADLIEGQTRSVDLLLPACEESRLEPEYLNTFLEN